MRLNPDCIRDILLAVEASADSANAYHFSLDDFAPLSSKYDYNTFLYHLRQCDKFCLIDGLMEFDCGESGVVSDLSPSGHEFLANVRENKIWNGVKSIACKVGSTSLDALVQIASSVVTELIRSQFGLIS